MLKINEIFYSIQGESSHIGRPCIFVRLTKCNLRCSYCDTEYAFYEGDDQTIETIIEKIKSYPCRLVEITGGEPLLQPEVNRLMQKLLDSGFEVLLETSGSLPIIDVPKSVKKIVDFKTPSSNMSKFNCYPLINDLQIWDEIKFVIGNREDYEWSKQLIEQYNLTRWTVLFSPVWGKIEPKDLSEWILKDGLQVRFQLQLHKIIWPDTERGV